MTSLYSCSACLLLSFGLLTSPAQAQPKKAPTAAAPFPARPVRLDAATGLALVSLPAGCFRMGSPVATRPEWDFRWRHLGVKAPIDDDERPVHKVCVGAFSIGQTEVTAAAWEQVTGSPPPFGRGKEPAAGISWLDVQGFLKVLNRASPGRNYRLPTEAEWEYACRAGQAKEPLRERAELIPEVLYGYLTVEQARPNEVAHWSANPWGLFDMLGNVWEWTSDVYRADAYRHHRLFDPRVNAGNSGAETARVTRGASFRSQYLQVRCAARGRLPAGESLPQVGFRLAVGP